MEVSVIVPTYKECENLPHLVRRLAGVLDGQFEKWEVIVSDDDSRDGTVEACAELAKDHPVTLLTRTSGRGLSPAVIDGIGKAAGRHIVVMDADLSHPPETIPEMVRMLREEEADFVIGSRYVEGGQTVRGWPLHRRLNSWAATMLVRPLVSIRDPMSGFFAFARARMPDRSALAPVGYKIGLEILIKGEFARAAEVPILFSDRVRGESKLGLGEQVNYLRHLRRLYHHRYPRRMELGQFVFVGAVGLVWDLLFYHLLQLLGAGHVLARAISFWPAVTNNWFLNRIMTFKGRERDPVGAQWAKFVTVSAGGFLVSWGAYVLLTAHVAFFDAHRVLALLVGVVLATAFNFTLSDLFVYVRRPKGKR